MVFYDAESIPLSSDFLDTIANRIKQCRTSLVLIGSRWLEADGQNLPRLFQETDVVRLEVEFALKRAMPVLPILVSGTVMPKPDELPPSLRALCRLNAAPLSIGQDFSRDVDRICDWIESHSPRLSAGNNADEAQPGSSPNVNALISLLNGRRDQEFFSVKYIRAESDLRRLWQIDARAYGSINLEYETYAGWWRGYPKGLFGVYQNNEIVGGFGIWPAPSRWIKDFSAGKVEEHTLSPADLKRAGSKECGNWYISGIVVDNPWRNGTALVRLLVDCAACWVLDSNIKKPAKLWAMGVSPQGEQLLCRFGFRLHRLGKEMKDGYPLFESDLETIKEELFR